MDLEKVPAADHHPELCKPAAESFKQKFKPAQSSPPCEHTASQTFPKFFSTVEGCELELRKLGLEYWTKHTLERVRFSQAIDAILGDQGGQLPKSSDCCNLDESLKWNRSSLKCFH